MICILCSLHCSPVDGKLIASGSDDQQIAISDWMRERMVTKFDSGHEMNVFQVSKPRALA